MEKILLGLGAVGAMLLIVAILVAWWEHHRRLQEIRQQLAWSENSRFALEARAQELDARLLAVTSVLQAQQQTPARAPAAADARPSVAATPPPTALQRERLARQAGAGGQWEDTEPMVLATRPMEDHHFLDVDLPLPEAAATASRGGAAATRAGVGAPAGTAAGTLAGTAAGTLAGTLAGTAAGVAAAAAESPAAGEAADPAQPPDADAGRQGFLPTMPVDLSPH